VVIGPLIEDAAIEKVNSLVEDATSKGGKVLAGGGKHPLGTFTRRP
jgi:succinate-semialdehyde dehydrogenase/glutarate-semialdehyde dehydrogenase